MHRLTQVSLRYPKSTLAVIVLITLILSVGLFRLKTEYGYRVLIGDSHPSIRALDDFIARFGGGLPISVGWACGPDRPCQNALDSTSLRMANDLTQEMRRSKWVRRVYGIANAPLLVPREDGFAVRRFIEDGAPVSDAEELAVQASTDPLWEGILISEDLSVGVIIIQPVDTRSATEQQVATDLLEALTPLEASGFSFYLVGESIAGILGGRDLAESTSRVIPLTIAVIGLSLYGFSRSWKTACLAVGTVLVALLWTFGALGWLGWPQDGILEVLAPLILVVGVCDSVHLIATLSLQRSRPAERHSGSSTSQAILIATQRVGVPCLITTLTTGAGFLSFLTSRLDSFVRFGVMSTVGILACLALTFSLLPLLLASAPSLVAENRAASRLWDSSLKNLVDFVEARAVGILAVAALLLVGCGLGWLLRLRVDTDWYETFGEHSRVVRSIRFMETSIGQSETLELEIVVPDWLAFEDPHVIGRIRKTSGFLSSIDGLGRARSAIDVFDRVNGLMTGDDVQAQLVMGDADRNAQVMELISFDDADALAQWLTLGRTHIRISVEAHELPFSRRERILETVRMYLKAELPSDWDATLTGPVAMGYDWIRDVQETQVRSFPTAFGLVFVLVVGFLGSFRLAAAAMVPTVLPVVVTLGVMGWVGMTLDVGRAMIAAIMIGIAVDDAIHILNRYRSRLDLGGSPREAIREAVIYTGRAVVTTSLALSLGFLALLFSAWQTISSFGFFVAMAILAALAAALLVLPATIFVCAGDE